MAKNTRERLTEMITMVITPSMRAHLDHATEVRGDTPYAYLIREALQRWLASEDPLTPQELQRITKEYLATTGRGQGSSNNEDGHA